MTNTAPTVVVRSHAATNSAAATPRSESRGYYRPDIQGIRALAVLLVLFAHAGIPGFEGGYVGVDVFFVVSGFVITGQLTRQQSEAPLRSKLSDFYSRRIMRIIPAATVVLLVTLGLTCYWLGSGSSIPLAGDERWASLFSANFRFISAGTNYFAVHQNASPICNFWSLGVEDNFTSSFP